MSIEEEIKILENALSGAFLVPSECAFVSTEIIKICLDTLKTYESWENLIRYEIEKQIKAEVIDSINDNIHEIYKCQFYCMADMCEHDSPTVDMCIDCFYDAIQKSLEQLKEQNK